MPSGVKISHTVKVTVPGLDTLPGLVRDNIIRELYSLGNVGKERVKGVMRRGVSPENVSERGSVKIKVSSGGTITGGNLSFSLSIFSTLIQALVDETGAKAHFPPYKKGTKLFKWVQAKGLGQDISKGERQYLRGRVGRSVGQRLGKGALAEHNLLVDKQVEKVAFLIARRQAGKSPKGVMGGLPRPGDPLRKPFEVSAKQLEGLFRLSIDTAVARGIRDSAGAV